MKSAAYCFAGLLCIWCILKVIFTKHQRNVPTVNLKDVLFHFFGGVLWLNTSTCSFFHFPFQPPKIFLLPRDCKSESFSRACIPLGEVCVKGFWIKTCILRLVLPAQLAKSQTIQASCKDITEGKETKTTNGCSKDASREERERERGREREGERPGWEWSLCRLPTALYMAEFHLDRDSNSKASSVAFHFLVTQKTQPS